MIRKTYTVKCSKSGISTTCLKCYHGTAHNTERGGREDCMKLGDCIIKGKDINVKCEVIIWQEIG